MVSLGWLLELLFLPLAAPDRIVGAERPADAHALDHKLVFQRAWEDPRTRVKGVRKLMDDLAGLAA